MAVRFFNVRPGIYNTSRHFSDSKYGALSYEIIQLSTVAYMSFTVSQF